MKVEGAAFKHLISASKGEMVVLFDSIVVERTENGLFLGLEKEGERIVTYTETDLKTISEGLRADYVNIEGRVSFPLREVS